MALGRHLQRAIGKRLARLLPPTAARAFVVALSERDPQTTIGAVARFVKSRALDLDRMPFDLAVDGAPRFEHFAGLFASTTLDEAVISMNVRQAAYLWGLVETMKPEKVIEIGRYKGGTTLLIAAAMHGRGKFWSIDIAGPGHHLEPRGLARPVVEQVRAACRRFGVSVELITGDSRTVDVETGEVDMVFVDGDHSYEGAMNDFVRFGTRVRAGGALLYDDAFDDGFMTVPHTAGVGPVVREIEARGDFRLVKVVNRLAHLERIR
ncbi:MAG: class I SAM-dependent methyltransferase [Candidatus Rokubacteria bacterium]|nr:class I SAM-dependent methyltransferase [Candidatus Rokubacteria bacterium]